MPQKPPIEKDKLIALLEELQEEGVETIPDFQETSTLNVSFNKETELSLINEKIKCCDKCPLSKTRTNPVFGEGSFDSEIVFVGEAPGQEEDLTGKPFVGRAGKLLTDIIEKGMKMSRKDVFICNVLKCRPPGNRDPKPEEVEQCIGYLIDQIHTIDPKVICALGRHAASVLLNKGQKLSDYRGTTHRFESYPVIVTYHPSALLRNPNLKKPTWEDIKILIRIAEGEDPDEIGAW
ncbi:uracil-DNA glycosylase [candidate division WOR-3 bacterium]|nr:uracil-DNA glycosylase [candidate division WOR-3 bacterium]